MRSSCRCPVHSAGTDRVRLAYTGILIANWSKKDIKAIQDRTQTIMLDQPCSTCQVLDDLGSDVLDWAARQGRKYAEAARAYVAMLYGDETIGQ